MSTTEAYTDRRFYRSADRAVLGGVCAGMETFGSNAEQVGAAIGLAQCPFSGESWAHHAR